MSSDQLYSQVSPRVSSQTSSDPVTAAPAAVAALRDWVAKKAKNLPAEGLTDDLPLLAGRHLTSLHIPELILLLERLRGEAIDVERLQPGDFQDIRTIANRFLPTTQPADDSAGVSR